MKLGTTFHQTDIKGQIKLPFSIIFGDLSNHLKITWFTSFLEAFAYFDTFESNVAYTSEFEIKQ